MGFENARDIMACGFLPDKTFVYSVRDYRLTCPAFEVKTLSPSLSHVYPHSFSFTLEPRDGTQEQVQVARPLLNLWVQYRSQVGRLYGTPPSSLHHLGTSVGACPQQRLFVMCNVSL